MNWIIMSRPNRKHKVTEYVVQVIAEMHYAERIGKDPYDIRKPMPKPRKYWDTLHGRKKERNCLGYRLDNKPPF